MATEDEKRSDDLFEQLVARLFPVVHPQCWRRVNLATELPVRPEGENQLLDPEYCGREVERVRKRHFADGLWGGYLENRERLWRGSYLPAGEAHHLGVDFTVPAHTVLHMPADGFLRGFMADFENPPRGRRDGTPPRFGWGGRVWVEFDAAPGLFFTFGHLDQTLHHGGFGRLAAGRPLGLVGDASHNGGWWPHLHVQCGQEFNVDQDGYAAWSDDLRTRFPDPVEQLCRILTKT